MATTTMKQVFLRTKELLKTPARWYKGYWGVTRNGTRVHWTHHDIFKCCLGAALYKAEKELNAKAATKNAIRRRFYTVSGTRGIFTWNDNPVRTHKEVINLLNTMIKQCK